MTDRIAAWRADPVTFCEEAYTPRGCKPGEWRLSPRQADAVRRILGPNPPHLSLLQWPKRSLKSGIAACCLCYVSLFRGHGLRSVVLSTSERSASSTVYAELVRMCRQGPLAGLVELQATKAFFTPTGSEAWTLPATEEGATGITIDGLLVSDELWASPSEGAYHLLASQTEDGQVLMISQASALDSYVKKLCDLFESGEVGPPDVWVDRFVPTPELPSPNPRLSASYLEARRRELPANLFASYFLNEWASSAEAVFTAEDLEGITADYALPRNADDWRALQASIGAKSWAVASGLDRAMPGSKHGDRSVFATVGRRVYTVDATDREEFLLLGLRILRTGAEAEVLEAHRWAQATFGSHLAVFESYMASDVAARANAEILHPTGPRIAEAMEILTRLVFERRFIVSHEAGELLSELGALGCSLPGGTHGATPRYQALRGRDDTVFASLWPLHKLATEGQTLLAPGNYYQTAGQAEGAPPITIEQVVRQNRGGLGAFGFGGF